MHSPRQRATEVLPPRYPYCGRFMPKFGYCSLSIPVYREGTYLGREHY